MTASSIMKISRPSRLNLNLFMALDSSRPGGSVGDLRCVSLTASLEPPPNNAANDLAGCYERKPLGREVSIGGHNLAVRIAPPRVRKNDLVARKAFDEWILCQQQTQ